MFFLTTKIWEIWYLNGKHEIFNCLIIEQVEVCIHETNQQNVINRCFFWDLILEISVWSMWNLEVAAIGEWHEWTDMFFFETTANHSRYLHDPHKLCGLDNNIIFFCVTVVTKKIMILIDIKWYLHDTHTYLDLVSTEPTIYSNIFQCRNHGWSYEIRSWFGISNP